VGDDRKQSRIDMYQRTLREAKSSATDPNIGISLIHWPVPHLPVIYDRETDEFKWTERSNYLDNLALVDRTVGEIRAESEAKGLWDDTVVVITSDHPARRSKWGEKFDTLDEQQAAVVGRKTDPRVPFLLKLRGQKDGVVYEPAFNTVLTADILLAILRGEISSVDSLKSWLDQHGTIGESPYKKNRLKQKQREQGEQDDWSRSDSS
jgi:arylsulfatase A-like enzyme